MEITGLSPDEQVEQIVGQLTGLGERFDGLERKLEEQSAHSFLPRPVGELSDAGVSEFYARADHVHPGVTMLRDSDGDTHIGDVTEVALDDRYYTSAIIDALDYARKAIDETITGAWTASGDWAITGGWTFSEDQLFEGIYELQFGDDETFFWQSADGVLQGNADGRFHFLKNAVGNRHLVNLVTLAIEEEECRLQLIAENEADAGSAIILTNAPAAGNNLHWVIHHTGPTWAPANAFEIGYGTSAADGAEVVWAGYTRHFWMETTGEAHFSTILDAPRIGVNTAAVPHGGVGGGRLAVEGTNNSAADGPHVQFTTATDDYPLLQMFMGLHDAFGFAFDCYFDGQWRSSDGGSNFLIYKGGGVPDTLRFLCDESVAQSNVITWVPSFLVRANGNILVDTIRRLEFNQVTEYINSEAAGYLNLHSDTRIDLESDVMVYNTLYVDTIESIAQSPFTSPLFPLGARFGEFAAGDWIAVGNTGDVIFHGQAGLAFGEIWVLGNAVQTAIAAAGTFVQFTEFANNGQSLNTDPDHTQNHITVPHAGRYFLSASVCAQSIAAGGGDTLSFQIRTNNGVTVFNNMHTHRRLAGGGGDVGSVSISGIADLGAGDTVELWVANDSNIRNFVVADVNLSVVEIGGT